MKLDLLISNIVIVVFAVLHIDGVFIELPMSLNVTMGGVANFTCVHTASDFIGWRVNGSSADILGFPCVRESIVLIAMPSVYPIHVLTIDATPECNNTVVECVAVQLHPASADFSPNVSLTVQGPLGAVLNPVVNLSSDSNGLRFHMSWEAPFSLDLTNVDPDVVYCIQIVNITCGANTVFSNCSISENALSLVGYSGNQAYEFTIFPRNNVKEALNGTPSSIRVNFTEYTVKYIVGGELEQVGSDEVVNVQLTLIMREETSTLKTTPKYYSLSLHPLDGNGEDQTILETCIVNETSDYFKLSTLSLPHRRRWNVNVLPYDCNENPVSDTIELSTHDIQNISVTSASPGEVRVTYDFIEHATAIGLLAIIYSLEFGKMNMYYFQALAHTEIKDLSASMHGVPAGHYGVSVFCLERGGLPFKRTALTPKEIYVQNTATMSETESSIQYAISQDDGEDCIECTFADDSNDFCVVIIHRTLSCNALPCEQTLASINASYKFTRSGDKAKGCVGDIDFKEYQVGVIGGQLASDSTSTGSTFNGALIIIAGIVIILPVLLIGVIMIILVRSYCCKRKKSRRNFSGVHYVREYSREAVERNLTSTSDGVDDSLSSIRTTDTYLSEDEPELPHHDIVTSQEWTVPDICYETGTSHDQIWQQPEVESSMLPVIQRSTEVSNVVQRVRERTLAEKIHRKDTDSSDDGETQYASISCTSDSSFTYPVAESTDGYEGRTRLAVVPGTFHESAPTVIGIHKRKSLDGGRVSLSRHVVHFSTRDNDNMEKMEKKLRYPVPESISVVDTSKSLVVSLSQSDDRDIDGVSVDESISSRASTSSVRSNKDSEKVQTEWIINRPFQKHVTRVIPLRQTTASDDEYEKKTSVVQQYREDRQPTDLPLYTISSHSDDSCSIETTSSYPYPNLQTQGSANYSCKSEEGPYICSDDLGGSEKGFSSTFESVYGVQSTSLLTGEYHMALKNSTLIIGTTQRYHQSDGSETEDYVY